MRRTAISFFIVGVVCLGLTAYIAGRSPTSD